MLMKQFICAEKLYILVMGVHVGDCGDLADKLYQFVSDSFCFGFHNDSTVLLSLEGQHCSTFCSFERQPASKI